MIINNKNKKKIDHRCRLCRHQYKLRQKRKKKTNTHQTEYTKCENFHNKNRKKL